MLTEQQQKTSVLLSKKSREHFLPSIKESVSLKGQAKREEKVDCSTINMKELQNRLHKMRNSRIGKKILIINAYGI